MLFGKTLLPDDGSSAQVGGRQATFGEAYDEAEVEALFTQALDSRDQQFGDYRTRKEK